MTSTSSRGPGEGPSLDLLECLLEYAASYFRLRNLSEATRRGYLSDQLLLVRYLKAEHGVSRVTQVERAHVARDQHVDFVEHEGQVRELYVHELHPGTRSHREPGVELPRLRRDDRAHERALDTHRARRRVVPRNGVGGAARGIRDARSDL